MDVPSGLFESQTLNTDLFHNVPDLTESHHIIDLPQAGHVGNPARWNILLPKFLRQILPVREQLCWKIPIHVLLYLKMPLQSQIAILRFPIYLLHKEPEGTLVYLQVLVDMSQY